MNDFRQKAEHFLLNETQFHLGMLPTEQSHPKTRGLSETLQRDLIAGIRMLQAVDTDVANASAQVFHGAEFRKLVETLHDTLRRGRKICFSGCGATGRLSILLEACWRKFWLGLAEQGQAPSALCASAADRVCSIMTGGDYALIRSVENFEDYISFGRRQVVEAGLTANDTLVAISEGGETSSVIGTIHEACARGLQTFFVFNNPSDILAEHIERSRRVIEDAGVVKLDLTSGPMAVAGSTRMQATTAELLVVGAALEEALALWLADRKDISIPGSLMRTCEPEKRFYDLLAGLAALPVVEGIVEWVELERKLYSANGRLTYFADECLLDIFTDTTERAPTFMLPPFRKINDHTTPPSWAFVKNPLLTTPETWHRMLGRKPRCLEWDAGLYKALKGPPATQTNPPQLGCNEILKFAIGCENDPARYKPSENAAMAVLLADESSGPEFQAWLDAFTCAGQAFKRSIITIIGESRPSIPSTQQIMHIPCSIETTPLGLWRRLTLKLLLNTVSTATMGSLGRLTGNWMANVETSNKKLIDRGVRLIAELAEVPYASACHALYETLENLQAANQAMPGPEKPSPVAVTIERLRKTPRTKANP